MTYYNNFSLAGTIINQIQYFTNAKGCRAIFDVEYIDQKRGNSKHRYHCIAWDGTANEILNDYHAGDNVYITGEILNNNIKDPSTGRWQHYMQVWVDEINRIEG